MGTCSSLRRRMMMSGGGALPYDSKVEYLENVDSAYIDTGIKASGTMYIKTYLVDFFTEANLSRWPFGGRNGYRNAVYGINLDSNEKKLTVMIGDAIQGLDLFSTYPQSSLVEMKRGKFNVNNTKYTIPIKNFTSSYNLILFGLNNGGSIINGSGLKFGATYITDGTVTLDLIPVRKDGIGYMYDKISGRLYGNANTQGSFILGPDV